MEKKISAKETKIIDLPNKRFKAQFLGGETHVQAKGAVTTPKQKKLLLTRNQSILVLGVVVLLVLAWFFVFFLPSQYRFSFNIDGLDYHSNVYTPSEFFNAAKNSNNFIVSLDMVEGANTDQWAVNSMNLWLVAFNANKKNSILVVKTIDGSGNLKECLTNDGNVLQSRALTSVECGTLLSDSNFMKINLHPSNENKVILSKSSADVYFQSGKISSTVNFLFIKSIYSDFAKTLDIINEKIGSINIDFNRTK